MSAIRLAATIAATLLLLAAPAAAGAEPAAVRIANGEAARWYRDGSPALFVDLRTAGERAQGGPLVQALWVPLGAGRDASGRDAARLADEVLRAACGDRTRTVVLVCDRGVKAVAGAAALRARDFPSVLAVEGGLWAGEPWLAFELE